VLQGPGENAGVVDLGGGTALAFRIESHNHPSAIEPVQGAATGVGGILRDIITAGARPVALLDSLRFGDLRHPRTRFLFEGVVSGISQYGNCVGVPTVGGEIYFDEAYCDNPLVNVMCLGLLPTDRLVRGRASGAGNPVFIAGARTGRDGIHGASLLASREFDEESETMRPAVQVGDPFREKLLMEACMQLSVSDAVVGINDLGAAGLTSAAAETASRAGTGMRIDVSLVPRREEGMTPYEVMLSESQERMLVIARRGREVEVEEIFRQWELEAARIGEVTPDGQLTVLEDGILVASMPARSLTEGAPAYERPARPRPRPAPGGDDARVPEPADLGAALLQMLSHPNLCSRRPVYEQYDHMVGINTVVNPGADAAVLRIPGSRRGVAATVDGNGALCHLDPRRGAAVAVAESYRNLSCVGARPLAVTNCLNFASPERPEVMWDFVEVIAGMADACRELGTPVTGGNVSFYNEMGERQIHPTVVIGMVGVADDVSRCCRPGFVAEGHRVLLLGGGKTALGGSQYLGIVWGEAFGPVPRVDFAAELAAGHTCRRGIAGGLIESAHDVSDGGLAVALAEAACLSLSGLGAEIELPADERVDQVLFGEGGPLYLVTAAPGRAEELGRLAGEAGCPLRDIGEVGGSSLVIAVGEGRIELPVAQLIDAREGGLQ
ncbi:MAG: phosphoribosylformylglycinamidine synthase subunit PurL, partial [Bacillota bacterium]